MNPLANTVRIIAGIPVAGSAGESAIDKFFRQQLWLNTGHIQDTEIVPISATEFAMCLRHGTAEIYDNRLFLPKNTPIIPAFRDTMGFIYPCRTAAMKTELDITEKTLWKMSNTKYEGLSFIVFDKYPNSSSWKHAFFVDDKSIVRITE